MMGINMSLPEYVVPDIASVIHIPIMTNWPGSMAKLIAEAAILVAVKPNPLFSSRYYSGL